MEAGALFVDEDEDDAHFFLACFLSFFFSFFFLRW